MYGIKYFSNPLTYAVCLEELGEDIVHKFQGRAPSGRTFNEIALDHQGKNIFSGLKLYEVYFKYPNENR